MFRSDFRRIASARWTLLQLLKTMGPKHISILVARRLKCYVTVNNLDGFEHYFYGKRGFEIGGPSAVFKSGGTYEIYRLAEKIDNCNFSDNTTWGGDVRAGMTFAFDGARVGHQYICEGAELVQIGSEDYDFVLSSHVLEHIANPLKALLEWRRILRCGGVLLLRVPHRDGTFDHRRPVTTLSHLKDDLESDVDENDLTHLPEILDSHDLSMDSAAGDLESFVKRSQKNPENRCLHHHVFTTETAIQLVDLVGLEVILVRADLPFDITILCRKSSIDAATVHQHNAAHLSEGAEWRRSSPFSSDYTRSIRN